MSLSAQERAHSRAKFEEYRRTGDRKLRNELIEAHKSLASHLARRYANRGEPFDDLLQVAYLGMLKAVERFDPLHQGHLRYAPRSPWTASCPIVQWGRVSRGFFEREVVGWQPCREWFGCVVWLRCRWCWVVRSCREGRH